MSRIPLEVIASTTPGGGFTSVMDALLNSQKLGMANQYYPALTQSTINQKNAEASRAPFQNALENAQTQMQQARNPYEADLIQAQIANQNAAASRAPHENAYNDINTQTLAAGLPYIGALNQAKINQANAIARAKMLPGAGSGSTPLAKSIADFQRQLSIEHPDWDAVKIVQATDAQMGGSDTFSNGEKIPALGATAQRLRSGITTNTYNKGNIDQMRFANTLDSVIKQSEPYVKLASVYAGPIGQARLAWDKFQANMGNVSPEYNALTQLKKVYSIPETAEAVRLSGVHSNNAQLKKYGSQFDESAIETDPDLFLQTFENMKNVYSGISKSIAQTPGEIEQKLRNGPTDIPGSPNNITEKHVTEDNIQETMRKTGLSRKDVMQKLKEKGVIK